jgi:ubiquinone/menaquinone biosynthesis C-methylase UbiE
MIFPKYLLPLIRCTDADAARADHGVLRLLDFESSDDQESEHARELFDDMATGQDYAEGFRSTWRLKQVDDAEIVPTMAALGDLQGKSVLELGCGTGRYTLPISKMAGALVAVDFSIASLRRLAQKLEAAGLDHGHVGLVQADATKLAVEPGAFNLVTSTLVSNIDTAEKRARIFEIAARALRPGGRFIFSVHHHDLRDRMRRRPKETRYTQGGIKRIAFTAADIEREARPYFPSVRARPIQVTLPGAWQLRLPLAAMSRLLEPVPLLNDLGLLLLVEAIA